MKVIFLDLDGVVNCADESVEWIAEAPSTGEYAPHSPILVRRVNRLIKETGAVIVVSSTWRLGSTDEALQHLLLDIGIQGTVIGSTPSLHYPGSVRGNEIKVWLGQNKSKVDKYVILDDDSDMLYEHRNNFVHTNGEFGFSEFDLHLAIQVLNGVK